MPIAGTDERVNLVNFGQRANAAASLPACVVVIPLNGGSEEARVKRAGKIWMIEQIIGLQPEVQISRSVRSVFL